MEASPSPHTESLQPASPLPHILPASPDLAFRAFECLQGSEKESLLPAHNRLVHERLISVHRPFLNCRFSFTVSKKEQTFY